MKGHFVAATALFASLVACSAHAEPRKLGCLTIEAVDEKADYPELADAVATCIDQEDYVKAAPLYAMARVYALYDSSRVTDRTGIGAARLLMEALIAKIAPAKVSAFNQYQTAEIYNKPAGRLALCNVLAGRTPPAAVPQYMITHGLDSFRHDAPQPLKASFNPAQGWKDALEDFLHCSSPTWVMPVVAEPSAAEIQKQFQEIADKIAAEKPASAK